ncbi:unnamed protein product [Enterobius vermicularis]|uniref:Reverse transcriptase domain-containing protein n=1 Tax=Enterobius vermicularis TaxID=51028 RepID=A0A0N4VNT1_ENTVE|nr:unnamed protein product [Enterobius vermicularis]
MDDLEVYGKNKEKLEKLIEAVRKITMPMGLNLNEQKCAIKYYRNVEETTETSPIETNTNQTNIIPQLLDEESYKYLGIRQELWPVKEGYEELAQQCVEITKEILNSEISFNQKYEELAQQCVDITREILNSEISWNQKCYGFKTLIVGKLRYIYETGSLAWERSSEMISAAKRLDSVMRQVLNECKGKFQGTSIARLYLDRGKGGCGWPSLEKEAELAVINTYIYLRTQQSLREVYDYHVKLGKRRKRSLVIDGERMLEKYGMQIREGPGTSWLIMHTQNENQWLECKTVKEMRTTTRRILHQMWNTQFLNEWQSLEVAGKIWRNENLDIEKSFSWLKRGWIGMKVMRNVIAAQENAIYCKGGPMNKTDDKSCRKCGNGKETVDHILNHCNCWLKSLYMERHNAVARNVYFVLCKRHGLPLVHYSHTIPNNVENEEAILYWDTPIFTEAKIIHNRPDIVAIDKRKKKVLVIEFSIAGTTRLADQRAIKINRYKLNSVERETPTETPREGPNLIAEIRKIYRSDVYFLPIIVGPCGELLKGTFEAVKKRMELNAGETEKLIERIGRSAAEGSSRIISTHLAT